jgi:UDP-N-acetyl-D-mannosaminuronate dehydrogenase
LDILKKLIQKKEAVVGIIGLGYVGLPIAVEAASSGYKVIGFDVQSDKINLILEGKNYIKDVNEKGFSKKVYPHVWKKNHTSMDKYFSIQDKSLEMVYKFLIEIIKDTKNLNIIDNI